MIKILKKVAGYLPLRYQQWLRRIHFARQIRKGIFASDEPEFYRLNEWVKPGDWVLDIGANVGVYTLRLSEIVGATGRVFAFEPVPQTFELLASNAARAPFRNITLLNVAASTTSDVVGMKIPKFGSGLDNYYQAILTEYDAELTVISISIDCLNISRSVKLAKIDVEGHEIFVLQGMENLIKRDSPILIVEGRSDEVVNYLELRGYAFQEVESSPNRIFIKPNRL